MKRNELISIFETAMIKNQENFLERRINLCLK